MSGMKLEPLHLDPSLQARLAALAERRGSTLSEFAEEVLRSHADEAEHALSETAEDERRWQRFLESGASVPFEKVRGKLRRLAAEAAQKMEPQ